MTTFRLALGAALTAACSALAPSQGLYIGPQQPSSQPSSQPTSRPHGIRSPLPRPAGVRATELKVTAAIVDGVATTKLRQVFHNDGARIAEGTWILPLPLGAAADRFTMTVGGKETAGEVLGADQARRVYEDIVRRQRDPGLLEYFGSGCLRARIFPIPAHGDVVVTVQYRQVLPQTAGLYEWAYPLRAAGIGGALPEKISLDLSIRSSSKLKTVYSPLAGVDVQRTGEYEARASLELSSGHLPERDLSVFFCLSDQDFGLHLLTHRKPGEPGYFMLMLSPKRDWPVPENTAKMITFVIDTSGSMKGVKIEQARNALRYFLQSLDARDRFNVVPFSTGARPFFADPVPASADNLEKALAKTAEIEARGGTNIEEALSTALKPEVPRGDATHWIPITVFLTDGQPTVGTTEIDPLLKGIAQANHGKARIFVFGVGDNVNSRLLDRVAADSGGDRDYVREHESIEIKTDALFTKLSHPVMTDVELSCAGIEGFDAFPQRTPDLFVGSRLLIVGRYRGKGHHAIQLAGIVNGKETTYIYEGDFPEQSSLHDFVPVLWAERKIGFLLDQIRLHGQNPELITEVRRLGVEFGIVTPFTSHLIVEEGMRVSQARGLEPSYDRAAQRMGDDDLRRVRRELGRAGALPATEAPADARDFGEKLGHAAEEARRGRAKLGQLREQEVGKGAVDNSVGLKVLAARAAPQASRYQEGQSGGTAQLMHRRIAGRSFYLAGGVWVDGRYRAEMKERVLKVEAFSDDYFALLHEHPELAAVFAFSTRVVVLVGDRVVEVVSAA